MSTLTRTVDELVLANRRGVPAPWNTLPEPQSVAEAEAIQNAVSASLGATVGGWKVSFSPDGSVFASPIFSELIWVSEVTRPMPRAGGIEVEFAVILAKDLPQRSAPYERNEILAAVSGVIVGIEVIDSRLGDLSAPPLLWRLADSFGCAGYIKGVTMPSWHDLDLRNLRCIIEADNEVVFDKAGCHPQGDPLEPFVAFAQRMPSRLGGLKAGQVITTGSLNGLLSCRPGVKVTGRLEGIGSVSLQIR